MRGVGLLSVCALLLGGGPARAGEVLLDHAKFVREAGVPQQATAAFTACDPGGLFTLVVENGQDGARRVSSGVISLNGMPVVTQDDFGRQTAVITKQLLNVREENQLDVQLHSAPGSFIGVTVEAEMTCLEISIDSPVSGSTVAASELTVFGRTRHRTPEIGVTVNGVLALVNGDEWVANNVPLAVGANTLTATAIDATGRRAQASIAVTCVAAHAGELRLRTEVEGGIAPLTTGFFVSNDTGSELVSYAMDFEGDGVVDLESKSFEGVRHTYAVEGIYPATLIGLDAAGNRFTAEAAVNVHPLPPLRATWDGMKGALAAGDLSRAAARFTAATAETYGEIFESLASVLPQVAAAMGDIELIYLRGDRAKYRLRSEEVVDGKPVKFTYYVYFARDADGFWRIRDF